jgi:hypothetical protein
MKRNTRFRPKSNSATSLFGQDGRAPLPKPPADCATAGSHRYAHDYLNPKRTGGGSGGTKFGKFAPRSPARCASSQQALGLAGVPKGEGLINQIRQPCFSALPVHSCRLPDDGVELSDDELIAATGLALPADPRRRCRAVAPRWGQRWLGGSPMRSVNIVMGPAKRIRTNTMTSWQDLPRGQKDICSQPRQVDHDQGLGGTDWDTANMVDPLDTLRIHFQGR